MVFWEQYLVVRKNVITVVSIAHAMLYVRVTQIATGNVLRTVHAIIIAPTVVPTAIWGMTHTAPLTADGRLAEEILYVYDQERKCIKENALLEYGRPYRCPSPPFVILY